MTGDSKIETCFCVYMHKNKLNGKIYIGQTKQEPNKRWRNGDGYKNCPRFYNAIQKYGWDNFDHIILNDNLTSFMANILEEKYIKLYKTQNEHFGYNISSGGGNHSLSEDTKRKIGEANKKRIITDEMHKNFSNGQKGNNNRGKKVLCIETEEIFASAAAAAREKHISDSGDIGKCCKHKQGHKTAGGYHWEYI